MNTITIECEALDGSKSLITGLFNGYFNRSLNLVWCKVGDVNYIGTII